MSCYFIKCRTFVAISEKKIGRLASVITHFVSRNLAQILDCLERKVLVINIATPQRKYGSMSIFIMLCYAITTFSSTDPDLEKQLTIDSTRYRYIDYFENRTVNRNDR